MTADYHFSSWQHKVEFFYTKADTPALNPEVREFINCNMHSDSWTFNMNSDSMNLSCEKPIKLLQWLPNTSESCGNCCSLPSTPSAFQLWRLLIHNLLVLHHPSWKLKDSRKHKSIPWHSWTSRLFLQPLYESSNKKLPVRTEVSIVNIWQSGACPIPLVLGYRNFTVFNC